ncbi:MAG TPA: phosphopentomutase, partial [Clostridiales bacterium]|nr:phosphopentomutase [Clostridiales bacterium]
MADRVFLIVMDSLGVGEMPDAADFGDEGSHTLGNIIKELGSLEIPNLVQLGIGNINGINIPCTVASPIGNYGKASEISKGKDTTT